MGSILVYTAQFCERDTIAEPFVEEGVDYVCFTDDPPQRASAWTFKPPFWCDPDPRVAARHHKILGLELFREYDHVLWLDGSLQLTKFPVNLLINAPGFALFRHRLRDCVYAEIEECRRTKRAPLEDLARQEAAYRSVGCPERYGLFETGFLWRHNSSPVRHFCRKWWQHTTEYTIRDQISFAFLGWRNQPGIKSLPGTVASNDWTKLTPHSYLPDDKYLAEVVGIHRPEFVQDHEARIAKWREQWGRFSSPAPGAAAPRS